MGKPSPFKLMPFSEMHGNDLGETQHRVFSDRFTMKKTNDVFDKQHFAATVACIVTDLSRDSKLFCSSTECKVPRLDRSELNLGRLLGCGGFSTVYEVSSVRLAKSSSQSNTENFKRLILLKSAKKDSFNSETTYDTDTCIMDWEEENVQDQVHARKYIADRCANQGDTMYAIKMVDTTLAVSDPHRFCDGIVDLAIETRFLAVINHPNIIKLRAMALGDPFREGHFIVLDHLYQTLADRLRYWTKLKKSLGNKKYAPILRLIKGTKNDDFLIDQLLVAIHIASAIKYLHSLDIAYRDLKPDNVGFDVKGNVKIFDFGLAKELRPEEKMDRDVYELSGLTGSICYMAPEVALCKPYNLNVDMYSFGILLWQMCALKVPFATCNMRTHRSRVVKGGHRPKVNRLWPKELKKLMTMCWAEDSCIRPPFDEIADTLKHLVDDQKQQK